MPHGSQLQSSILDTSSWQGQGTTSRCNCLRKTVGLLERIPAGDIVPFDFILQLHHSVVEQWGQTARCRHCSNNWNAIHALTTASEKVIALFEAASYAYTSGGYFPQGSHGSLDLDSRSQLFSPMEGAAASNVTCTRAQMSLGEFALQDDEANLLAIQVIYKSLVTHCCLLEDLRDNQPSQALDQTFGNDGASIQYTIDRLLRMLGRIHWEQDSMKH